MVSTVTKVAAGVAVVAAAGIAIAVARGGGVSPPPSQSITITATPTSLPDTGGVVTINGTTTGIADGTVMTLLVNGVQTGTTTLSGGAFTFTYDAPPNTGTTTESDVLQVTAP
jgi:hypothetical protein